MNIDDPQIVALRAKVRAAQEEFDQATAYHEAWKPAAYDMSVHERMGTSYASTTFSIIRQALRREMLLALARLWDTNPKAVSLLKIANSLENGQILDALAAECAAQWGNGNIHFPADVPEETQRATIALLAASERQHGLNEAESLKKLAIETVAKIREFGEGGNWHATLTHLLQLRHEHLAHRQVRSSELKAPEGDRNDEAIERFYQEMSDLIRTLTGVVMNTDYRPKDTAELHRKNAEPFWAGVRGERTEGHPNYKPYQSHSFPRQDNAGDP